MRRGLPVVQHLSVLVGVPLLAALLLAGTVVRSGLSDQDQARGAAQQMRTSEEVDAVRRAVDAELLPTLVRRVAEDPVLARRAGLVTAQGADAGRDALLAQSTTAVEQARAATDGAAARVREPSAETAVGVAMAQLVALRADADHSLHGLAAVAEDYRYVSDVLVVAERDAALEAAASRLSRPAAAAVQDVQQLVAVQKSASRQLPAALVASVTTGGDRAVALHRWRAASGDLEGLDDPDAEPQAPWLRIDLADVLRSAPSVELADRLTTGWALDPATPDLHSFQQLLALRTLAQERDVALDALVQRAHAVAEAATARDVDAAGVAVEAASALCAVLLLGAVGTTALLARSLAGSLRHLGRAAREVSEGGLVAGSGHGPRELREVGQTLLLASQGLHRVRQQVEAVARGDLDRATSLPPAPGVLGEAVQASVASLVWAVSARDALSAELVHRADHDHLTGLLNRAASTAALHDLVERSRTTGEQVAVLFVDLDGFKAVNDGCGHAAGDELLRVVAGRLLAAVRAEDVVGRLGGDEFVVVLADVTPAAALVVAQRLVSVVAQPVLVPVGDDTRERAVGASIGVSLGRAGSAGVEQLLERADTAVYRAKELGRGRVVLFDEAMRREVLAAEALTRELREGLSAGSVAVRWEPQVISSEGLLVGHRALPQLRRSEGELVGSAEVRRCAEAAGLGRALGRLLLEAAVDRVAAQSAEGQHVGVVVLPLTDRHLSDPVVVDDVGELLDALGLLGLLDPVAPVDPLTGARRGVDLYVEVGERSLADPGVRAHLRALRALGVGIGVVAVGGTRLRDVPQMPADVVVVGEALVGETPEQQHVCRLVVGAALAAGVPVRAEGVTSRAQADRLLGYGVVGLCGPLVDHELATTAGAPAAVTAPE